ncbi:MAG TPA: cell division protein SepF, partial [Abditibacteriaceae bacterium]
PTPTYGGGSGSGSLHSSRRLRAVPSPLRSREKNIYTIKPKSQDDAAIAADYLKTGDAVIVNLEEVDRVNAVRIIDFMSGVCYGLEGQGHAMKLGDAIFLYTPPEFEIRSDEVDYGENEDFFFKDVQPTVTTTTHQVAASSLASAMTAAQGSPIPPQGSPIPQQGSPIPPQTTPSGYTNPAVGSAQTTPYQGVGLPPRDRRPWES